MITWNQNERGHKDPKISLSSNAARFKINSYFYWCGLAQTELWHYNIQFFAYLPLDLTLLHEIQDKQYHSIVSGNQTIRHRNGSSYSNLQLALLSL